ncbi:lens epithelial cell protein LEP503 [Platysternon megacephalum]|uniref:Lens epithelial cell protein LEP503 n=1 Tax=Platysternon megacephalum TaxID=55544 RepID=A0A4D9DNV8_9SAUR|nr:lens epithelial cell protein LEP503 [Platysternon megacephalum]
MTLTVDEESAFQMMQNSKLRSNIFMDGNSINRFKNKMCWGGNLECSTNRKSYRMSYTYGPLARNHTENIHPLGIKKWWKGQMQKRFSDLADKSKCLLPFILKRTYTVKENITDYSKKE